MWYVYVLGSRGKEWRYVGFTEDLKQRFREHNGGKSTATKPYKPFELMSYVAVKNRETALQLEKYYKSGSGIAWMNKHLLTRD